MGTLHSGMERGPVLRREPRPRHHSVPGELVPDLDGQLDPACGAVHRKGHLDQLHGVGRRDVRVLCPAKVLVIHAYDRRRAVKPLRPPCLAGGGCLPTSLQALNPPDPAVLASPQSSPSSAATCWSRSLEKKTWSNIKP